MCSWWASSPDDEVPARKAARQKKIASRRSKHQKDATTPIVDQRGIRIPLAG
jgi:hypothetical protein